MVEGELFCMNAVTAADGTLHRLQSFRRRRIYNNRFLLPAPSSPQQLHHGKGKQPCMDLPTSHAARCRRRSPTGTAYGNCGTQQRWRWCRQAATPRSRSRCATLSCSTSATCPHLPTLGSLACCVRIPRRRRRMLSCSRAASTPIWTTPASVRWRAGLHAQMHGTDAWGSRARAHMYVCVHAYCWPHTRCRPRALAGAAAVAAVA